MMDERTARAILEELARIRREVQDDAALAERILPGITGFRITDVNRPALPSTVLPPPRFGQYERGRHRPRAAPLHLRRPRPTRHLIPPWGIVEGSQVLNVR